MTQLPPSTCARQFVARPFVGGALPDLVQWGGPWATSPAVHSDGALEVFMGTASSHGGHLSPVWEEVRQNALTLCKANEFVLAYLRRINGIGIQIGKERHRLVWPDHDAPVSV